MGGMRFELNPLAKNPRRTYTKRRKYGPIIDEFLSGRHDLFRVIESRGLGGLVKASVVNDELYLERTG
jgi:hypothetical protein